MIRNEEENSANIFLKIGIMKNGAQYTVSIVAEDAWGVKSEPVTLTVSK